jgi:hypothetical protein
VSSSSRVKQTNLSKRRKSPKGTNQCHIPQDLNLLVENSTMWTFVTTDVFLWSRNRIFKHCWNKFLPSGCKWCLVSLFWDVTQPIPTFRDNLSIRSSREKLSSWTVWPLMMERKGCTATSLATYQSTLRNIPEKRISHLHRAGSLKARIVLYQWYLRYRHAFVLNEVGGGSLFRANGGSQGNAVIVKLSKVWDV